MKAKLFSLYALFLGLVTNTGAQEFPIGIWLDGNQNAVNDVDNMGFTWVTAYGIEKPDFFKKPGFFSLAD